MKSAGVITIGPQTTFAHHRCGWEYAIDALRPENNERGIQFEGFLDQMFSEALNPNYSTQLPIDNAWTGFFHNPASMPAWFPNFPRLSYMFSTEMFRRSIEHCVGIFVLSEHLASYLRSELNVPVSSLIHPTEIPERTFSYEAFLANRDKTVVSIGWWLRRTMSILYLPLDSWSPYRKARLQMGDKLVEDTRRALSRLEFVNDWKTIKLKQSYKDNTKELSYIPNDAFDDLLSKNLVFLDLYDASANNTVVECIARTTPMLVNPRPAVVEYLGPDYPFYFDSLDEAAAKACDFDLVKKTHDYLLACPTRMRLSQSAFLFEFRNSVVYSRLRASLATAAN